MTKQEEVRVGLGGIKLSEISYDGKTSHTHFLSPIDVKNILSYLHSQDVVIKVERELPIIKCSEDVATRVSITDFYTLCDIARKSYKESGYVAVEPLIKEVIK